MTHAICTHKEVDEYYTEHACSPEGQHGVNDGHDLENLVH